jgi:hypothetical protein
MAVDRRAEADITGDRHGVRVEQQLVRVAALPGGRIERPAHPEAVFLARFDPVEITVPDTGVQAGQWQRGLRPVVVEQAQQHLVGNGGIHGDVDARPGEVHTQRKGRTRSYGDGHATECRPSLSVEPVPLPCRTSAVQLRFMVWPAVGPTRRAFNPNGTMSGVQTTGTVFGGRQPSGRAVVTGSGHRRCPAEGRGNC